MKTIQFLIIAASVAIMSSCDQPSEQEIGTLRDAKERVQSLSYRSLESLAKDEQALVEKYFYTVAYWAWKGERDRIERPQARFTLPQSLECTGTLVDYKAWSALESQCTQSGLYLCPEEVRLYPESLKKLKKSFSGRARLNSDCERFFSGIN